jgi:hypothetical protein
MKLVKVSPMIIEIDNSEFLLTRLKHHYSSKIDI